jgi:RND family efflux transporter MFP subunit
LAVAEAGVRRAEAELETARIRLRYTRVTASWSEGDDERVVAERHVDVGQTVSPGEPLLRIVGLNPLTGVLHVTEKDFSRLARHQAMTLVTDVYPGESFPATISRIAPVFRESSRQARVEVLVPNLDQRLKPGMFMRATVVLASVEDALSVPESALTSRGDRPGVFVVDEESQTVSWRPVTPGIRDGGRLQILGEGLSGRVVTLGQQLIDDGSSITIPADADETERR